jgi:hypothetical protein
MPEIEVNLVICTLKSPKVIDVETNNLIAYSETENSVTEKTNMEQSSIATNSGLKDESGRNFTQTKLTSTKRENQEKTIGRGRRMNTNRSSKFAENFCFDNLPWPKVQARKVHGDEHRSTKSSPPSSAASAQEEHFLILL